MASGCIILDECPVCGDIVYEDDWDIDVVRKDIIHSRCQTEQRGIGELRKEIQALRDSVAELKEWADRRADELQARLAEIERETTPCP
jgi:hypothetical protein